MANPIKYSTGSETNALKKGNFFFGTGDVGKGPSDVTGYYQGVDVPQPGYVVYQYLESSASNLTYAALNSDAELINFTNGIAGQTLTSTTQCFAYYAGQTDKICFNRDYEPIITDGLILNVDAGFDGSYPASGNTWRDLSVSGNNGTLTNNPGFYDNGGGGIVFDGTDDFVNLGNQQSLQFTDNFSSFCWIYKNVNQYQKGLVGNASYNNGGWQMSLANNFDKFVVIFNSNAEQGLSSNSTLNAKQWYHCGFTFLDGVLKIYIDGVFDSQSTGRTITTNTNNFVIGKGAQGGWGAFNGNISSVQVYDRALSDSEVLQNYNAMKDRFAFIFTVDTTKAGTTSSTQFKLPLVSSGSINFVVEWGDGTTDTITTFNQAQTTHTYSSGGTYEIKIRGILRGWQFNNGGDRLKMGVIKNWGCLDVSVDRGFSGCENMTCIAIDAPVVTSTSLLNYFADCTIFDGNIGSWDVSNISNFSNMFYSARAFNNGGSSSINNWQIKQTGSVVMSSMFGASHGFKVMSFNQPIGNWNMSNVTNVTSMFYNQRSFNQDLSSWDVSNLTNLSALFSSCSSFNQDISGWDVSNVTNMNSLFNGAISFNQDISGWDVSNVTNMADMFSSTNFNQDISGWDMSNVTNMSGMFRANNRFNQNINIWNTSSVTNMGQMFYGSIFNQPIGDWDVSSITDMNLMFGSNYGIISRFNQDISNWNISGVTNFNGFISRPISTTNYDSLLVDWENTLQTAYPGGSGYTPIINISFGTSKYTSGSAAATARQSLIDNFTWTISDGGPL
jgi:surface protein